MNTKRSLVGRITVRHVSANDPYIGIIRLDRTYCDHELLTEIGNNGMVRFDAGDRTDPNHWLESISYIRGVGEKWSKSALFIQYRHGPKMGGELVSGSGLWDQLYIALNTFDETMFSEEALQMCLSKAHVSIMDDDGAEPYTPDVPLLTDMD